MAAKELIQTITVGSGGASSIEFTSIPQDGTDLLVVFSLRGTANGGAGIRASNNFKFNSSSTGYALKWLYGIPIVTNGSGSETNNTSGYGGYFTSSSATSNTFGNGQLYLPNYTGSQYKSWSVEGVGESNDASSGMSFGGGLWSNTAAITSITLLGDSASGDLAQYSTASLYKFTKGSGGATVS